MKLEAGNIQKETTEKEWYAMEDNSIGKKLKLHIKNYWTRFARASRFCRTLNISLTCKEEWNSLSTRCKKNSEKTPRALSRNQNFWFYCCSRQNNLQVQSPKGPIMLWNTMSFEEPCLCILIHQNPVIVTQPFHGLGHNLGLVLV